MWSWDNERKIEDLKGLTLSSVERLDNNGDEIIFTAVDGKQFKMWHEQDCCESVYIKDIVGELSDLVGSEILMAEQAVNQGPESEWDNTSTWTFYKLATNKGYVTISWEGSSNGYYSEGVSFYEM